MADQQGEQSEDYANDPRPSEQIAAAFRAEIFDEDSAESLVAIHWRGGKHEFDLAREYCDSADELDRTTGAYMLAQLGFNDGGTYLAESVQLLIPMLQDESADVVQAAAIALGQRRQSEVIPFLLAVIGHPDKYVRHGIVHGLMEHEDSTAIAGLIRLTTDPDENVRDWALFALGSQIDSNTLEIRDALASGLDDDNVAARSEAIAGLVRCEDPRAFDAVIKELSREWICLQNIRNAADLASPDLLPRLTQLRLGMPKDDDFGVELDAAIQACRPEPVD